MSTIGVLRDLKSTPQQQQQQQQQPMYAPPYFAPPPPNYHYPNFHPNFPNPQVQQLAQQPAQQPAPAPVQQSIPSSPIAPAGGVANPFMLVQQFFNWARMNAPTDGVRQAYNKSAGVAEEQFWTLEDLKEMSNINSDLYRVARDKGLPDGIIRGFRKAIKDFKVVYRQQMRDEAKEAAHTLARLNN